MSPAVEDIRAPHAQRHNAHEQGIPDHPVNRRDRQQQRDSELRKPFEQPDCSECPHTFVGDDCRIVGYTQQIYHKSYERELKDNLGSRDPLRRNRHLLSNEPESQRLTDGHDNQCQNNLNKHSAAENCAQAGASPAEFKGDETGYGGRQCPGNYRKHGNDAADDVIYAIVAFSESPEHNTRSVQPHKQQDRHPHIEKQSVFRYLFRAIRVIHPYRAHPSVLRRTINLLRYDKVFYTQASGRSLWHFARQLENIENLSPKNIHLFLSSAFLFITLWTSKSGADTP